MDRSPNVLSRLLVSGFNPWMHISSGMTTSTGSIFLTGGYFFRKPSSMTPMLLKYFPLFPKRGILTESISMDVLMALSALLTSSTPTRFPLPAAPSRTYPAKHVASLRSFSCAMLHEYGYISTREAPLSPLFPITVTLDFS